MERLIIAVVVIAAASVTALIVQRRRPDAPTTGGYEVPTQLDRADFAAPATRWLIAVFTSATCQSCAAVWRAVEDLRSDDVTVQDVEVAADADLHDRYAIEAVPCTVIADAEGVVRASFLGPITRREVATALDQLERG